VAAGVVVTAAVAPPAAVEACDACLRRTHLLGLLAAHIQRARQGGRHLPELLALPEADLLAGLAGQRRGALERGLAAFDAAQARRAIDRAGLAALCRHAERYPVRLAHARDAPAVLHVAGDAGLLHATPAVAVVGTRRATPYGLDVARGLARALAACGVPVVSGMALGIDAAAHHGALAAPGPTVAVLPGGADVAYPASKRALRARIAQRGCVVAEMAPGFAPRRWSFPARNRIIAALAELTVVVEGAERSGSLITADLAAQLGRAVGAVPGPVTSSRSAGANALLRDGAHVVRSAQDVLDLLAHEGWRPPPACSAPERSGVPAELRALLGALDRGPVTPEALAPQAGGLREATVALSRLELAGAARRLPDGSYVRRADGP
jgi:DNA processing protein